MMVPFRSTIRSTTVRPSSCSRRRRFISGKCSNDELVNSGSGSNCSPAVELLRQGIILAFFTTRPETKFVQGHRDARSVKRYSLGGFERLVEVSAEPERWSDAI